MSHIHNFISFINESNKFNMIEKFIQENISDKEKLFISFSNNESVSRDFNQNYSHKSPKGFYAYPLYNPDADLDFINNWDVNKSFRYFTERKYTHFIKLDTLNDIFIQDAIPEHKLLEYEDIVADILIQQYDQKKQNVYSNYLLNHTVDGKYENGVYNTTVFYEKIYIFIIGFMDSDKSETEDVNNIIPDIFKQLGFKGILTYTERCIDRLTPNQLVLFDMNKILDVKTLY